MNLPCYFYLAIHKLPTFPTRRSSDPLTICRKDYHFGVVRGNLVPVVVQNNVEAKVRVADRVAAEDWYAGKLQGFDEPVPLPKLNLKTLPTIGMRPDILPKL